MKGHRKFFSKSSWAVILIMLVLTIYSGSIAQAYTVFTRVWPASNTSYTKDTNFINRGSGWGPTADNAAADWNTTGQFTFSYNGSSTNHIKAQAIAGSTSLAITYDYWSGLYRNRYDIVVNTGPGYGFWDGINPPYFPANWYDLRSVLRHEMGHALGLYHTVAAGTLMYYQIPAGATRLVDTDATNGAKYLYNLSYTGSFPEGEGREGNTTNGKYDEISTVTNNGSVDGRIGYAGPNWVPSSGWNKAYNSSISYANAQNSKVWIAFNGSRITRHFTMASNRGTANVYIDGTAQGTISDNATNTRWQAARTWSVSPGEHIIEFRLTNTQFMDLDAFTVDISSAGSGSYDNTNAQIQYVGSWVSDNSVSTGAYNMTTHYSNASESAAILTFSGTSVTYVYTKASNRGKAGIVIDGVVYPDLDLYSAGTQWQQSTTYGGLSNEIHTLHISVLPSSNNAYVDVDRFIVQ